MSDTDVIPSEEPPALKLFNGSKQPGNPEFVSALEKLMRAILEKIPDRLEKATAPQLMLAFAIATDKRQILKGEPTQILSIDDRKSMRELMPAMLMEAQRRGLTIDMTATEVDMGEAGAPAEVRLLADREAAR